MSAMLLWVCARQCCGRFGAVRSRCRGGGLACPGPGSTASPICEPTSTDSVELPQPRPSPSHQPSEDQPNRCNNGSTPPSTKSPDSKPTITNSDNTSPNTSVTGAKTTSPPRQRHVSHTKPKLRTTKAPSPTDKHQQSNQTRQTRRLRVPTIHQLPDPGAALRRKTQLDPPQHHHSPLISEEPVLVRVRRLRRAAAVICGGTSTTGTPAPMRATVAGRP